MLSFSSRSLFLSFILAASASFSFAATMDAYEKLEKIGEGTYGKVGDDELSKEEKKCRASSVVVVVVVLFVARIAFFFFCLSPSFSPFSASLFSFLSLSNHTLTPLQVYKAKEKSTGRLVALKKTRLEVRKKRRFIRPQGVDSSLSACRESLGTVAAARKH